MIRMVYYIEVLGDWKFTVYFKGQPVRYTVKNEILNSETHHNQSQSESQSVVLKCKGLKMCLTSAPIEFQNKNEVT